MYNRLMAVIFDFPVALTSDNIHNSPTVLLDPKNVGHQIYILSDGSILILVSVA